MYELNIIVELKNRLVWKVFWYGSESRTLTKEDEKRTHALNWVWRRIFRRNWTQSNVNILVRYKVGIKVEDLSREGKLPGQNRRGRPKNGMD